MSSEITAVRTYVLVALVLLVLTGLTIGVAFLPFGPWHTPVALGIAATKALLVAWFFMHLRAGHPTNRLTALGGLLWLSILLAGTLDDVVTRGWLSIPGK